MLCRVPEVFGIPHDVIGGWLNEDAQTVLRHLACYRG